MTVVDRYDMLGLAVFNIDLYIFPFWPRELLKTTTPVHTTCTSCWRRPLLSTQLAPWVVTRAVTTPGLGSLERLNMQGRSWNCNGIYVKCYIPDENLTFASDPSSLIILNVDEICSLCTFSLIDWIYYTKSMDYMGTYLKSLVENLRWQKLVTKQVLTSFRVNRKSTLYNILLIW